MIIKIVAANQEDKYLIEASWIKWSWDQGTATIAVYTHITTTKQVGSMSKSEIEVAHVPSMYIHPNPGDTVFVMNNDGKTIDKKKIVIVNEGEWVCPQCSHLNLPSEEICTGWRTTDEVGVCRCVKPKETK